MNDANDPLNNEAIEDLLRPLGTTTPSDAVRSANRAAVERALERRTSPPWWRRTVVVPMPVAIAASLALVLTAAASLWPAFGRTVVTHQPVQELESTVETDTATPRWSITQSYLLSLESLAQFQNSIRHGMTEDRNDS